MKDHSLQPEYNDPKYSGADWLRGVGNELSPFGERVADLVGQVWQGIYHLQSDGIVKVDWSHPRHVEMKIYGGLSSYDNSLLTQLVVRCHDDAIRLEIRPCNFQYLRLWFSERQREGSGYERHPSIEEAIQKVRGVTP